MEPGYGRVIPFVATAIIFTVNEWGASTARKKYGFASLARSIELMATKERRTGFCWIQFLVKSYRRQLFSFNRPPHL